MLTKEKGGRKMKRPLSLVGFIVATAVLGIDLMFEFIGLAVLLGLGGFLWVFIGLIGIAFVIVALVFNAISISSWNKKPENYKKGFVLATVIINFALVLFLIIGLALGSTAILMSILLIHALVATNVLVLIDLSKANKEITLNMETTDTSVETTDVPVETTDAPIEKTE